MQTVEAATKNLQDTLKIEHNEVDVTPPPSEDQDSSAAKTRSIGVETMQQIDESSRLRDSQPRVGKLLAHLFIGRRVNRVSIIDPSYKLRCIFLYNTVFCKSVFKTKIFENLQMGTYQICIYKNQLVLIRL